MNKELITDKQAISIVVLYICGSTLMFDTAQGAKQDIWLAILLAFFPAFAVVMAYGRILYLFPSKNLFNICTIIFGKWVGGVICLLYALFGMHLASLVLYDFSEYMGTIGLDNTPQIVSVVCITLLILWIIKEGIVVIGRWSEFFIVVVFILIFTTLPLFFPLMDINNLKPFAYDGISPITDEALGTFTFPFTEIVIFMGIFSTLKSRKSSYKVYGIGLALGAFIVFTSSVTHVLVLSPEHVLRIYFPPYYAFQLIDVKNFLTRIEIIIGAGLMIGGFIKITICLLACCKGICQIFDISNYRIIATPVCILAVIMTMTNYNNMMELLDWTKAIWKWYALFFEVGLPTIILIGAEIKSRRNHSKVMT